MGSPASGVSAVHQLCCCTRGASGLNSPLSIDSSGVGCEHRSPPPAPGVSCPGGCWAICMQRRRFPGVRSGSAVPTPRGSSEQADGFPGNGSCPGFLPHESQRGLATGHAPDGHGQQRCGRAGRGFPAQRDEPSGSWALTPASSRLTLSSGQESGTEHRSPGVSGSSVTTASLHGLPPQAQLKHSLRAGT